MNETWQVASITSFEQIPVGDAGALLRIAAVSARTVDADEPRPTLVADDGYLVSYFAALPAPPDTGAELRCAFSVPAELVAADTVFSLELDDGDLIALPPPHTTVDRLPTAVGEPDPAASLNSEDALEADAPGLEFEFDEPAPSSMLDLLLEAAEARAELQAVHELMALGVAGAPPRPSAGDAEGRLAELELWSAELERRLAETTTALAEAEAQLELYRAAQDGTGAAAELTRTERTRIGAAAVEEAHRRAVRDLADATS